MPRVAGNHQRVTREASPETTAVPSAEPGPPRLPAPEAGPADDRGVLRAVRAFCLTGRDPDTQLKLPGDDLWPALMHAMRNTERVRTGDPIVLTQGDAPIAAFSTWLDTAIESAFRDDDARELRDNARRLERAARTLSAAGTQQGSLAGLLTDALGAVIDEIDLRGEPAIALRRDTETLAQQLDARDRFVSLGADAPLAIMLHIARRRTAAARAVYTARLDAVRDRLRHRLAREASPEGEDTVRALSGSFDPKALGRIVGSAKRGSTGLSPERRERIARLIEQLGQPDHASDHVVVSDAAIRSLAEHGDVTCAHTDLPCAEAVSRFEANVERALPRFLALRVAELEAEDAYDAAVHDPHAESFGFERLTEDELATLPAVIAVESLERLAGPDMPNVVRALLSGRPVRVLLETEPAANTLPHADHEPLLGSRFDPGMFGIGLRAPIVHQSAVSAIEHLASGLERAIGSAGPSLHVVASGVCEGGADPVVGRWLHSGAAVDSRAHPLFLYDPNPGPNWADRFDISGNDQPETSWPEHELACADAAGVERPVTLAFSFADHALLEPAYRDHFRVIPESCPTNDLAPAGEVIADPRDSDRRAPFVWATDRSGTMVRLAVSHRLINACRDRLSCWHTLQELAGVHDAYAEAAVSAERDRARAEAAAEIAGLRDEHAAEIERVRRDEAASVLGRLAESIMGVDPSQMLAPVPARPRAPAPSAAPTPGVEADVPPADPASPEPDVEEEPGTGFEDPFIDSALCTSCNDCLNINKQMFVYNANKQATIGDPDAGTFRQLVTAAEKCPARCIHPGKPRNPDEPGLDELVERAKKFN